MTPHKTQPMVPVRLVRVVLRERSDQQWIFLEEAREGPAEGRGFPIVIGTSEASEIHRVLTGETTARPMTHQLAVNAVTALGSEVLGVDIVDLRSNTFYAQLRLRAPAGGDASGVDEILLDARPSDALALGLRAGAEFRVAESVLEQVRTDLASDELPSPGAALEIEFEALAPDDEAGEEPGGISSEDEDEDAPGSADDDESDIESEGDDDPTL